MSQSLLHQVTYSDPRLLSDFVAFWNNVSIPFTSGHVFRQYWLKWSEDSDSGSQSLLHQVTYSDNRGYRGRLLPTLVSIPFTSGHVFRLELNLDENWLYYVVSIPFTSGHVFRQLREKLVKKFPDVSIPFTSGHVFRLERQIPGTGIRSVSIPFTSGHVFRRSTKKYQKNKQRCLNPFYIRSRIPTLFFGNFGLRPDLVSIPFTSGHVFRR